MSDVNIRIRDNGPLVVEGPVTVTDADGSREGTMPESALMN